MLEFTKKSIRPWHCALNYLVIQPSNHETCALLLILLKHVLKSIYYAVNWSVVQIAIGKNDNLYCIILHQFYQNQVIGIWGTVKHIKYIQANTKTCKDQKCMYMY